MLEAAQIIQILKKPASSDELSKARALQRKHLRMVKGEGFSDDLKKRRIAKMESTTLHNAKLQLARPKTPALFEKFINQFSKAFTAEGYNQHIVFDENDNALVKEASDFLDKCWGGKSLKSYMACEWSNYIVEEFNGVIVIEVEKNLDQNDELIPYPKFYPLSYIFDIKETSEGIQYLVLKWEVKGESGKTTSYYRFIDKETDALFTKEGEEFFVVKDENGKEKRYEIETGYVPAIRVSNYRYSMHFPVMRVNHLNSGIDTSEQYQDICDDHIVSQKKHGYPLFYSKPITCPKCNGRKEIFIKPDDDILASDPGATGTYIGCVNCNQQGVVSFPKGDPTEGISLPLNPDPDKETSEAKPPAGFVQNDIESLQEMAVEKGRRKEEVEEAVLGVIGIINRNNKTATEVVINYAPLEDRLNAFTDNIELVHTFIASTILKIKYPEKFIAFIVNYGRKYIIQTPQEAYTQFDEAKQAGMPDSFLKELLVMYNKVLFSNNPQARARSLFLLDLEPFPTYTTEEVKNIELARELDIKTKLYFNDLIRWFELQNGDIMEYQSGKKYAIRIDSIQNEFERILTEKKIYTSTQNT